MNTQTLRTLANTMMCCRMSHSRAEMCERPSAYILMRLKTTRCL